MAVTPLAPALFAPAPAVAPGFFDDATRRGSTTFRAGVKMRGRPVSDLTEVDDCLIHTGSKKILDGVCSQLDLEPESAKVHGSYKVLERYGNLSSASTGFMLAEKNEWAGPAMVVGFGVGFTASAGIMNFN